MAGWRGRQWLHGLHRTPRLERGFSCQPTRHPLEASCLIDNPESGGNDHEQSSPEYVLHPHPDSLPVGEGVVECVRRKGYRSGTRSSQASRDLKAGFHELVRPCLHPYWLSGSLYILRHLPQGAASSAVVQRTCGSGKVRSSRYSFSLQWRASETARDFSTGVGDELNLYSCKMAQRRAAPLLPSHPLPDRCQSGPPERRQRPVCSPVPGE
jgi:hypothetical protein